MVTSPHFRGTLVILRFSCSTPDQIVTHSITVPEAKLSQSLYSEQETISGLQSNNSNSRILRIDVASNEAQPTLISFNQPAKIVSLNEATERTKYLDLETQAFRTLCLQKCQPLLNGSTKLQALSC